MVLLLLLYSLFRFRHLAAFDIKVTCALSCLPVICPSKCIGDDELLFFPFVLLMLVPWGLGGLGLLVLGGEVLFISLYL